MIRGSAHLVSAALIAACLVASAIAAYALTMNNVDEPGTQNPGLDVTRHAMPPPDVTAPPGVETPAVAPKPVLGGPNAIPKPAADAPAAAPTLSANPLWAIPLSALAATRNRPLFTPSRRPPAPIVANVPPPAPRPPPPPPPPAVPEHPNLTLVGTVAGENEGVAVFLDQGTHDTVRLRTGEGHSGWILQSVERSTAILQKGDQSETLTLPRPTSMQAAAPVISPLPPPPPPPPQGAVPVKQPPTPQSDAAPSPNPQQQGCMPAPIGC